MKRTSASLTLVAAFTVPWGAFTPTLAAESTPAPAAAELTQLLQDVSGRRLAQRRGGA
ncbi:MAG: hypothetical protein HC872_08585 [Gammaproteobacteria bacterium]|nr:hypothetical protein [Gammaproteobacteria bacterium]